jgi:hypothetical protein
MRQANIEIISNESNIIIIKDIGPWDNHPTITNDAEGVVSRLWRGCHLSNQKRLYYYDSEGQMDELLHKDGVFKGFKPGEPLVEELI